MSSELKVDTISEKTTASGVTIDGVLLKDSKIGGTITIPGSTGTMALTSDISAGGLTEADNWRLTTTVSSNTDPVTNWEREDSLLQGSYVGTGMTESSGIWTFPATGIYLVNLFAQIVHITSGATCGVSIYATNDGGSTYTGNIAVIASKGTDEYSNQAISTFVDITDTSLCKIKVVVAFGGSSQLGGSTTQNLTTLTFLKLGDT